MASENQLEKIASLVEPILNRMDGLYLVDVEIASTKIPTVWILLESLQGGISLDNCALVSRELSILLDAHEVFDGAFRLNVSSPGLDRPLKKMQQYRTNVGRNARVSYQTGETKSIVKGKIASVSDEALVLDLETGHSVIPFAQILETKILPAF